LVLDDLRARDLEVFPVSAATHEGLRELSFAMAAVVAAARAARPAPQPERIVIRPAAAAGGPEFAVTASDEGWRVRGDKPERWVRQTDFSNDEAVGFLADRLNRLGVEDRLLALGAAEGDAVMIGPDENAVVFDFRPMVDAGATALGARRGEDERFDEKRPSARRRRAIDEAYDDRGEGEARADVARRLREDQER
ncbi:MAG: GTPase, partial [Nocardioidaceae bacterium]|nr:GTPase [Nocardioidaceae bacterium]